MKVVLDSNILFSAMISSGGVPNIIFQAWRNDQFELITSQHQIDEIRRTSRYPKFKNVLQPTRVGTMINYLYKSKILEGLDNQYFINHVNDPNDAFLLGMTHESKADYLVTGDHRSGLFKQKNTGFTRIITLTDFCHLL